MASAKVTTKMSSNMQEINVGEIIVRENLLRMICLHLMLLMVHVHH